MKKTLLVGLSVVLLLCTILSLASCGIVYKKQDDNVEQYSAFCRGNILVKEFEIKSTYNDKPVTSVDSHAFHGCLNLEKLTIPTSITSIGEFAFYECGKLKEIIFEGTKAEWVSVKKSTNWEPTDNDKNIIPYIVHCTDGASLSGGINYDYINDGTECQVSVRGSKYSNDTLIIPNDYKGKPITTIVDKAFNLALKLKTVVIGENVTNVGEKTFSNSGITNATVPAGLCTYFKSCPKLETLTLSCGTKIEAEGLKGIKKLATLNLPATITEIGEEALTNCAALKSIVFAGTKEQWNNITFGENWNSGTGNYTVTCSDGTIAK